MHEDPFPFWDIHTSPLGLLLVWTFVLSIRRNRAGLAGDISGLRTRRAEAGDTEYSGAATIYSVIELIVRGTESVFEQSDWCICERVAGVCIHFTVYVLYIRRTLSCCICRVFHSVFSVYVHLMYFSYHCSLWMASTVLYRWILYLSVAGLLIMTSIILHRIWGATLCEWGGCLICTDRNRCCQASSCIPRSIPVDLLISIANPWFQVNAAPM